MRLLRTGPYGSGDEKFEIIQKWDQDVPPYAILSHTWSANPDDEVLLADVQSGTCDRKPTYTKLKNAMQKANLDGYDWIWIDNCCIDKTSSVELSEAINSMYDYYKSARKCYAFFSDVYSQNGLCDFEQAKWWTRGWTLQELLAPGLLEFFDSEWKSIGYKHTLHQIIAKRTGIDAIYLTGEFPVEHASIAKRMSWQASRRTTRAEDIAYSMIGLFDVNMPMLYGEGGTKAFLRLQEEIMRTLEDHSLFAWVKADKADDGLSTSHHGLLADSPRDFKSTGNTISYTNLGNYKPPVMTARGLHLDLPLAWGSDDTLLAAFQCPVLVQGTENWLAVHLEALPTGNNQYARVHCDRITSVSSLGRFHEVYVRQKFPNFIPQNVSPNHYLRLRSLNCIGSDVRSAPFRVLPLGSRNANPDLEEAFDKQMVLKQREVQWSSAPMLYKIHKSTGSLTTALLVKRPHDYEAFVVLLGVNSDLRVGVAVHDAHEFSMSEIKSFTHMQAIFRPSYPGQYSVIGCHRVRINLQEHFDGFGKTYYVDIEVEPLPLPPVTVKVPPKGNESLVESNRAPASRDFRFNIRKKFGAG